MTTGERLAFYRKKAGMSQEDLAERLEVTRQSISKWESDAAFPETERLIVLSDLFGISIDELIKGERSEIKNQPGPDAIRSDAITVKRHYEYKSKAHIGGLPLLHVNLGLGIYRAKGIVAVGNIATGVISAGLIAVGAFGIGVISAAAIAIGVLGIGLFAAACIALGIFAFGAIAFGVVSFGAVSIGLVSVGALSIGRYFACGDTAYGMIAIAWTKARGDFIFVGDFLSGQDINHILTFAAGRVPRVFMSLIRFLCAYIF